MKMALVHDIGESRSVDVDYIIRQFAEGDEEKSTAETFFKTTVEGFQEIRRGYEERKSIEPKIVKDADNLDMELQEYYAMDYKKIF